MHIESRLSTSVKRCILPALSCLLLAGCQVHWTDELKSIAITPSNPTVAKGQTLQLTATATLSDGSTRDITASSWIYWYSSDKSVAKVDGKGLVTGIETGATKIAAYVDKGSYDLVFQEVLLTVVPPPAASTPIGPARAVLKLDANQALTSSGTITHGRFHYTAIKSPSGGSSTSLAGFLIDAATGALTRIPDSPFLVVEDPVWIVIDPSERFLYLGCNSTAMISAYSIDPDSGHLTAVPGSPFVAPGPLLFMQVEPSGFFLYVGTEMAGVLGYRIDQVSGALTSME